MRLTEAAIPTFARHETFHPRYGWFRKAYMTAASSEYGFNSESAPVDMGVGKNMVRSIKFWGQAAKLITKDLGSPNPRSTLMVPTRFGRSLFAGDGWDPYMEDPGTLWLLHWMLLAPPTIMPVWWLAFNDFHAVDFGDDTLLSAVREQVDAAPGWSSPHPSSIKKDVGALLRTYAPAVRSGRSGFDDLLDCPLRELGLIARSTTPGNHRFVLGAKATLPPEIVTAAVLDYLDRRPPSGRTVTIAHLSSEAGSPGKAFKLNEVGLYEALRSGTKSHPDLDLVSPTGAQQLTWKTEPALIAVDVLNRYYGRAVSDGSVGANGDDAIVDSTALETAGSAR